MKLNAEDLVVSSFQTSELDAVSGTGTIVPNHPTPATRCFDCPMAGIEPGGVAG